MLSFGIITEVDAAKGLARVTFEDKDNLVSDWLPISQPKTGQDKYMIPYDVGERVWCMMDDYMEAGVIGGAIYDAENSSTGGGAGKARVQFVGGMIVEHSRNSNTLAVSGAGNITIDVSGAGNGKVKIKGLDVVIESAVTVEVKAAAQIKLTAPTVVCSGALSAASISTTGNMVATGNMTINGNITSAGEITANGIPLATHKHTGVTTGSGTSGTPIP